MDGQIVWHVDDVCTAMPCEITGKLSITNDTGNIRIQKGIKEKRQRSPIAIFIFAVSFANFERF